MILLGKSDEREKNSGEAKMIHKASKNEQCFKAKDLAHLGSFFLWEYARHQENIFYGGEIRANDTRTGSFFGHYHAKTGQYNIFAVYFSAVDKMRIMTFKSLEGEKNGYDYVVDRFNDGNYIIRPHEQTFSKC